MSLTLLVRLGGKYRRPQSTPFSRAVVCLLCIVAVLWDVRGSAAAGLATEPRSLREVPRRELGQSFWAEGWLFVTSSLVLLLAILLIVEVWRHRRHVRRVVRELDATIARQVTERTRDLAQENALLVEQLNEARTSESNLKSAQATLEETTQRYVLLSELDALTSLANRRKFDDFLDREWRRGVRNQQDLSLLLVDVDYFKLFNDTYGHGTGDDCLRAVAEVISGAARRPGDLAARIGGEEFAVLLCDTAAEGAMIVARQIHAAIEQLAIDHETTRVHGADNVTVSVGVVTMTPDPSNGPNLLFYRADEALYAAKQDGRNCVRAYDDYAGRTRSEASLRATSPSLRVHESLGRRTR